MAFFHFANQKTFMNDSNALAQCTPSLGDWFAEDLEGLGQCSVCTSVERSLVAERIQPGILPSTDAFTLIGYKI